jgi:hypothetical protein
VTSVTTHTHTHTHLLAVRDQLVHEAGLGRDGGLHHLHDAVGALVVLVREVAVCVVSMRWCGAVVRRAVMGAWFGVGSGWEGESCGGMRRAGRESPSRSMVCVYMYSTCFTHRGMRVAADSPEVAPKHALAR